MKSKGLLTASFLLLVLSGVIWWSNKKAVTPDKAPVETTTVKLLNLPEDQIQDIEIKKRTGETITVETQRFQVDDRRGRTSSRRSRRGLQHALGNFFAHL